MVRINNEARSWLIIFGTLVSIAVLMLAGASLALADDLELSPGQEERAFRLCERATARWERISEVPENLLQAISLAESGRWSARTRRVRAWPWTVTSGGPGSYFPSKDAAMNEVRRLQAAGVENIDVGCMQVNMQYHGQHFRSVKDAMDPDINAAYAAKFLTRLRGDAPSWAQAAGYYHSYTPGRTAYYRGKVEKFWAGLNGGAVTEDVEVAARDTDDGKDERTYTITPIDRQRTAALNARFTTLKTAARKLRDELDPETKRRRQIEAWRQARGRAEKLQHLLAVRQAEMAMRRERELEAATADRKTRFKENRIRQLADWRERRAAGKGNN